MSKTIVILSIVHMFGSWTPGTISDVNGVDGSSTVRIFDSMKACTAGAAQAADFGYNYWKNTLDDNYKVTVEDDDYEYYELGLFTAKLKVTSEYQGEVYQDAFSKYECEEFKT